MKKFNWSNCNELVEETRNGALISFPTETVYGFGVVYDNMASYKRLIDIKRRPPEKPFTLMIGDPCDVSKYGVVDERIQKIIDKFMPGEITLVLKAKNGLPAHCVASTGTIGIRVPDHKELCSFLKNVGKPMLVPSANRSGEPTLFEYEKVYDQFENELDAIIEGKCFSFTPSTVIDCSDKIKVLREGKITLSQILSCLEESK